jgi:hypothetical membrane protein
MQHRLAPGLQAGSGFTRWRKTACTGAWNPLTDSAVHQPNLTSQPASVLAIRGGDMTSIEMRHGATAHNRRLGIEVVRSAALATGLVSSLLYAAIDLLAGLRYEGYSFYSQTISELGAIGAPKPAFLAPLFLTYVVLMVIFGIAVWLEGIRHDERLKIVGASLLLYMLVGSGTSVFPVHVRGTATFADEMPHIVAGLAAVAVILITIVLGTRAIGGSFRKFSFATATTIIVFGALTVPSGVKLAAGQPTPGMGLLERIAYYSILVWIAGLSVALLRRAREDDASHQP